MDITHEILPKVFLVRPDGEINSQSSPALRKILLDQYPGSGSIVVNLANVRYIDSSGLATLVEGLQLARRGNGELALCDIREQMLLDLLEITHLLDAFPIFDSESAAIESFATVERD